MHFEGGEVMAQDAAAAVVADVSAAAAATAAAAFPTGIGHPGRVRLASRPTFCEVLPFVTDGVSNNLMILRQLESILPTAGTWKSCSLQQSGL